MRLIVLCFRFFVFIFMMGLGYLRRRVFFRSGGLFCARLVVMFMVVDLVVY